MAYPIFPSFSRCILVLTTILLLQTQTAQAESAADVGTVTQQITTFSAFPSQKACAQSCFIETGWCRNDVLGSEIGCAEHTDCADGLWLATNNCYCRTDLQAVAQSLLTACVTRACDAGNVMIDASSAGSIYSQYCVDKGFPAVAPVMVLATTTGKGASATAGSAIAGETGSSTTQGVSSSSRKLSTSAIIGIAIGGAIGLLLLITALQRAFGSTPGPGGTQPNPPPPATQEPFYPQRPYPDPFYPQPGPRSEVFPEDSVSMVGGMPGAAPTFLSAPPGYPPGYPQGYPQRY